MMLGAIYLDRELGRTKVTCRMSEIHVGSEVSSERARTSMKLKGLENDWLG